MLNCGRSSTRESYSITCYALAFPLDETFKIIIGLDIRLAVGQGLMLNLGRSSISDNYSIISCYVRAFSLDETSKTIIRIYIRLAVGYGLM